jgi:hypothetical protein
MKSEPQFLELSEDQSWNNYLDTVEAILDDYWLASNRNELDDKRWEKTVAVWANHLNKNRVPRSKLQEVYERALKLDKFVTVSVMLMAWEELKEEMIQKESIKQKLTGKNCPICKGKGVAMNFNFDTKQDEPVTCVCSQGA